MKLQLATKLGATDIVDVRNGDPVEQVKQLTKGQVHHAIEAVGAKVTAEVVKHGKADKIVVFKYKRRKGYARKQGHRQGFTEVRISSVSLG